MTQQKENFLAFFSLPLISFANAKIASFARDFALILSSYEEDSCRDLSTMCVRKVYLNKNESLGKRLSPATFEVIYRVTIIKIIRLIEFNSYLLLTLDIYNFHIASYCDVPTLFTMI